MVTIKIVASCKFLIPVVSVGGVILRETYCIKPKGHQDHHQNAEGGVMVNNTRFYERMGMK